MTLAGNGGGRTAPLSAPARRPVILLVKNEVLWRYRVAEALRSEGYQVVEATHGEEARTLLRMGLRPDLLISDIKMPGPIDGQGLAGLCRSLHPDLPVLRAAPERPAEAPDDMAFLAKPYTFEALIDAVRAQLGEK